MPKVFDRSPDHVVPPRSGKLRRRRVLVLAMVAALLGVVVLGRE